jgi:hypothetical protein
MYSQADLFFWGVGRARFYASKFSSIFFMNRSILRSRGGFKILFENPQSRFDRMYREQYVRRGGILPPVPGERGFLLPSGFICLRHSGLAPRAGT